MKPIDRLIKLKNVTSVDELASVITTIINGPNTLDNYIPAIIEEGEYTQEKGEDFYLKLVLKHQSIPLEKTWIKNNLSFGLEEPFENNKINKDAFIHNVITTRKYKSRDLYQLNPLLVSDQIDEYEYSNSDFVNAYFNEEYSNIKGNAVLKTTNNNKLEILKNVLKFFINDPLDNFYPKYELVAEFEYRLHDSRFLNFDGEFNTKTYFISVSAHKQNTLIHGSIIIPNLFENRTDNNRNVKVIDLHNNITRLHNSSHYNGDTVEGFVCFKKDVINVLKEDYYFYDLQIIEKNNTRNSYLIDVLEDKIVFWEGEYNKLPEVVKDSIDSYNFVPLDISNNRNLISSSMAAMQLSADWNWHLKLPPQYLLANSIRENYFKRAIDMDLTFIDPQNELDLKNFILKIELLTEIQLSNFKASSDVNRLLEIRNSGQKNKVSQDLRLLYQKYCYAIQSELNKWI